MHCGRFAALVGLALAYGWLARAAADEEVSDEQARQAAEGLTWTHHRPAGPAVLAAREAWEPPPSRCAGIHWGERLVVAARHHEDVSWMAADLVPWLPFLVYSTAGVDPNATHRTASNVGREAQAYLQFIVEYWDCLPQEAAFIHAHHAADHSPDMLTELKRLRWGGLPGGFVGLSRPQYVNLFFLADPDRHYPGPEIAAETAHWMHFARQETLNLLAVWPEAFQPGLGAPPPLIAAPCCGQFAASRARIHARPKAFYEGCLRWLQTTEMDHFWAGLAFEHMWALILGGVEQYTHPGECEVFACDEAGEPTTPDWRSLMPAN